MLVDSSWIAITVGGAATGGVCCWPPTTTKDCNVIGRFGAADACGEVFCAHSSWLGIAEFGASVVEISAGCVVGACVVVVVVISALVTTASSEIRVLGVASDDGVAEFGVDGFDITTTDCNDTGEPCAAAAGAGAGGAIF